jgi:hypothetical protein
MTNLPTGNTQTGHQGRFIPRPERTTPRKKKLAQSGIAGTPRTLLLSPSGVGEQLTDRENSSLVPLGTHVPFEEPRWAAGKTGRQGTRTKDHHLKTLSTPEAVRVTPSPREPQVGATDMKETLPGNSHTQKSGPTTLGRDLVALAKRHQFRSRSKSRSPSERSSTSVVPPFPGSETSSSPRGPLGSTNYQTPTSTTLWGEARQTPSKIPPEGHLFFSGKESYPLPSDRESWEEEGSPEYRKRLQFSRPTLKGVFPQTHLRPRRTSTGVSRPSKWAGGRKKGTRPQTETTDRTTPDSIPPKDLQVSNLRERGREILPYQSHISPSHPRKERFMLNPAPNQIPPLENSTTTQTSQPPVREENQEKGSNTTNSRPTPVGSDSQRRQGKLQKIRRWVCLLLGVRPTPVIEIFTSLIFPTAISSGILLSIPQTRGMIEEVLLEVELFSKAYALIFIMSMVFPQGFLTMMSLLLGVTAMISWSIPVQIRLAGALFVLNVTLKEEVPFILSLLMSITQIPVLLGARLVGIRTLEYLAATKAALVWKTHPLLTGLLEGSLPWGIPIPKDHIQCILMILETMTTLLFLHLIQNALWYLSNRITEGVRPWKINRYLPKIYRMIAVFHMGEIFILLAGIITALPELQVVARIFTPPLQNMASLLLTLLERPQN